VRGQQHALDELNPRKKTQYPFHRRLGGPQGRYGQAKNLAPTGIRSQDRPARSQSLYLLSYPAQLLMEYLSKIKRPPPQDRMASITAEAQTRHLPKTSEQCYRWSQVFRLEVQILFSLSRRTSQRAAIYTGQQIQHLLSLSRRRLSIQISVQTRMVYQCPHFLIQQTVHTGLL
jgi:hypothetical protein